VSSAEGGPLDERLALLRDAVEAARQIGLEEEAAAAREAARRVGRRAGFGGAVYVMALAGGTGVGKSSVLNALAGEEVSAARAIRPTTDKPVAWVSSAKRSEIEPLLEWLKVDRVVAHEGEALADVAILDLPDVDSVRPEHRAMVDALLPRIDAVTWIVDPEKYDDAAVHAYWRTLAPHADRLRFVLNKADRLNDGAQRLVVEDLRTRLMADGIPRPLIHVASATTGEGIDRLREALADAGHAKVIIAAKLEIDRQRAAERLAEAVGIEPETGYRPLLDEPVREMRGREAVAGALALIDAAGLARQIATAVMYRARTNGGSFFGRVVALVGTLTGRRQRVADPAAHLRGWRTRGSLGRVLNPLRTALVEASAGVPPASRGRLLQAAGAPSAEADVARVLDRTAVAAGTDIHIPRSPLWPAIGVLQGIVGAVLLFAAAWIGVLIVAGGPVPVGTFEAPLIGPIPIPLALLAGSIVISGVLGWLLGVHAGWIGRRLASRVSARTESAVREAIVGDAFAGLDRVEDARRTIARALVDSRPPRRGA
jgi:GTP-binding protein EngB required for normal cell division